MPVKRGEQPRPAWAIECKKAMAESDMTVRELAEALSACHTSVSAIMSGYRSGPESLARQICNYFGVEYDGLRGAAS